MNEPTVAAEQGTVPQPSARRRSAEQPLRLTILGATGSIGSSTLDVVNAAPVGTFEIKALTAHENVEKLASVARSHRAEIAVIADPDSLRRSQGSPCRYRY